MYPKRLAILGGYGNAGMSLARLLLQWTDVNLCLAGRSPEKAELAAKQLNAAFSGERVSGAAADAHDSGSLQALFTDVDMVVVASSGADAAGRIADAALRSGIDYLDILLSTPEKHSALRRLEPELQRQGRCFITDGGFHPGLPAAMVRYASQYFLTLRRARVAGLIRMNWQEYHFSPDTEAEFYREITTQELRYYRGGEWRKAGIFTAGDYPRIDFGSPFGKQYCAPMYLEEINLLARNFPSLEETGFYVAGLNWFVDWLAFPLAMLRRKWLPGAGDKLLNKLTGWGLRRFSRPPYAAMLQLNAEGLSDAGETRFELAVSHRDAYQLTAIPVLACLIQYLTGEIRRPGLWWMGHLIIPDAFFKLMKRAGAEVRCQLIRPGGQTLPPRNSRPEVLEA